MADCSFRKKRIAIFHYELVVGGAEKVIADIFELLLKKNYCPTIFTCYFDKSNSFQCFKENKRRIKCYNFLPFCLFGYFQTLLAVTRNFLLTLYFCLFYSKHYDIVIVDTPGHICIPLLKFFDVSVIFYCHFPDFLMADRGSLLRKFYRFPLDFIERKSMKQADRILCNSYFSKDNILKSFSSVRKRCKNEKHYLSVLYPFVDSQKSNEFLLSPVHSEFECEYFLSLNRFETKKNLELVLNAFKCFIKIRKNQNLPDKYHLVIAGAFDARKKDNLKCREKLEKLVNSLSLDKYVIFEFSPSEQRKMDLIYNSIGLIYTPIKEHFGIVPLEAMLLQCPVIVMNSGGPLETVVDSVTGYHCKPDPHSVAVFMEKLTDISVRKLLGKNGKAHCEQNFCADTFSKGLVHQISTICNKC